MIGNRLPICQPRLVGGHVIVGNVGLVAIDAPTDDQLQADVAAVEQAAVQASCETRLLVGQQAQVFQAVALPLCREV